MAERQKQQNSTEAWVRFGDDGQPSHVLVDVAADGKTVTVDRAEWNALAGRLGMSQTTQLPGDSERLDVEALAGASVDPAGNQRLGEPNRREDKPEPEPSGAES